MKYSDKQRIAKMRETSEKLRAFLKEKNVTPEQLLADETLRWTVTTPLYNIGEHAYQLSDSFKNAHPDIPWVKIAGLRHRLVHDYEGTNWNIIITVLFDVLPEFLNQLQAL